MPGFRRGGAVVTVSGAVVTMCGAGLKAVTR